MPRMQASRQIFAVLAAGASAFLVGCREKPAGNPVPAGTRPAPAGSNSADALAFVQEIELRPLKQPPDTVAGVPVVELSGLAYDSAAGELVAVTEDGNPTRIYRFKVTAGPDRLTIEPKLPTQIILTGDLAKVPLDSEGIVLPPKNAPPTEGAYYISVEGRSHKTRPDGVRFRETAAILKVGPDGNVLGYAVDPQTNPLLFNTPAVRPAAGAPPTGRAPVDNGSLESLAITDDGLTLYTAVEHPLVGDGPASDETRGGVVRIYRFTRADLASPFAAAGEFHYRLEPTVNENGAKPGKSENGLVELLTLGADHLLVMERSYSGQPGPHANVIRIYCVKVDADHRVDQNAKKVGEAPLLPKGKPVLDLRRATSPVPTGADNFEGMTWGPTLAGARTLILVSDDNGNRDTQRSTLFVYRVKQLP